MIDNPCYRCSPEMRKQKREEHGVLSCKTCCDEWKPYAEQHSKLKARYSRERQRISLAYGVKLDSMARSSKGRRKY